MNIKQIDEDTLQIIFRKTEIISILKLFLVSKYFNSVTKNLIKTQINNLLYRCNVSNFDIWKNNKLLYYHLKNKMIYSKSLRKLRIKKQNLLTLN